ncbi:MAG TPA: ketoacyl-ACP synthase III [Crocinitomicaceae bacterium]|nr:ketoacyl-ACP synthase III [Crocinitomicaceae bacterium]
MANFKIENIALKGIACCVPKTTEKTENYPFASEQEYKTFVNGTGIVERRVADDAICTSDMCFAAAEQLIKDMGIDKNQIKVLVFVSQSTDYLLPATAVILQDKLNLPKSCLAFDVGLGCSGYVYGLSIVGSLLQNMESGYALLLAGDKSTISSHEKDKSTRPLFGDAGSATLLEKQKNDNPMFFNLQSDGSGHESIIIRGGGTRLPYTQANLDDREIETGIVRNDLSLEMNGVDVFNFSLKEVKPNITELLENTSKTLEDIDFFVMHQANKFLNETVRKKIKFPLEKTPYSIATFGNTSSASIPLTLTTQLYKELANSQLNLLLSGFGVGLSWGSVFLSTTNIKVSELVEI